MVITWCNFAIVCSKVGVVWTDINYLKSDSTLFTWSKKEWICHFLSAAHINVWLIFVDNTILCCSTILLSRSISGKQSWQGFQCDLTNSATMSSSQTEKGEHANKQRKNWFFHQIRTSKLNFASLNKQIHRNWLVILFSIANLLLSCVY